MHFVSQLDRKHDKGENWETERTTDKNQVSVIILGTIFWCGIPKDRIMEPFEVDDGNVTGNTYRDLLIRKV